MNKYEQLLQQHKDINNFYQDSNNPRIIGVIGHQTEKAYLIKSKLFGNFWMPKSLVNHELTNTQKQEIVIANFKLKELLEENNLNISDISPIQELTNQKFVTIFTDASFKHEQDKKDIGYYGGAIWIKFEYDEQDFKNQKDSVYYTHAFDFEKFKQQLKFQRKDDKVIASCMLLLNGKTKNSHIAELKTLEKAIMFFSNVFDSKIFKLSVQSDCLGAIHTLKNQKKQKYSHLNIDDISFKHVYAHRNDTDKRHIVNNMVDQAAKIMRLNIENNPKYEKIKLMMIPNTKPEDMQKVINYVIKKERGEELSKTKAHKPSL